MLSVFRLNGTAGATELCFQQATIDNPFTVYLTASNTLKVVSTGSSFQFFINGTQVCKDVKSDPAYVTGALAVGSQFLQTAGNSFSISKVSVELPARAAVRQEANDTIDPADAFPAVQASTGIAVVPTRFGVVYVTH